MKKLKVSLKLSLTTNVVYAGFTAVVAQIVILDAVFSLDYGDYRDWYGRQH